ncbi:unnamed protein product [Vicia faba]|uniref:O-methyltransferase C-terminal domain-containing protein n=1 Tax=Vicia faba TaxID=3906 RepID=A0AAV0Z4F1_VICFA|nr:unnamed protein product [Vicia faba]
MANISDSKDLIYENLSMEKRGEQETVKNEEESFSYAMQLAISIALPMALECAIELGVFEVLQKAVLNCTLIPHDDDDDDEQNHINSFQRHYSMTSVAKFFAPNSDGVSLAPLIALNIDNIFLASWSQLKDAVQFGGTPFNKAHGTHLFDYPNSDSRFNQIFNTAMNNHSTIVMKRVLECYDGFKDIKRLVDVGGGLGMNINLITSKYTHIHGINFDLPHVIQHAPSYPGVEHIGGDMFESVPKGDAIFMKWILHDWSDERCLKLMKNCYDAIPDDGKVIVLEALLPIMPKNEVVWKSISHVDIAMMTHCLEGKERTEHEFKDLATKAGFRGIKYGCCIYNFWVMEFFK